MSKKNKPKGNKKSSPGKINYRKKQREQQRKSAQAATESPQAAEQPGGRSAAAIAAEPAVRACQQPAPEPSSVVSLEPLAPLIIRSGRPFDFQAGADAARFPPPSTVAGCLRTAWARTTGAGFTYALQDYAVAGPLLVRVDAEGNTQPLLPKPVDAHYFGHGEAAQCVRAEPRPFASGCDADLPSGLSPVQLVEKMVEKSSSGPRWWSWEDFIAWRSKKPVSYSQLQKNGWSPPPGERRTHVAIDPSTQAAETGRLFQTEGLDLEPDNYALQEQQAMPALRLLARFAKPLDAGLVHLGGERRLARLEPVAETQWPQPPAGWLEKIRAERGLTLTLLTPGIFARGYRPDWLDAELQGEPPGAPGVRLKLVAAALESWQPHSGWNLKKKEPRATRKLVAAGATYWFHILGDPSDKELAELWLNSLCDEPQDRRDGFGIALPAPWTPTV
ncbi:type III-B CRISPR module-associated protein Cmr3 [Halorhodospira halochloris]|uniref:type III-B CRISPR module-associated protein Cmr3 n=1 Tax=Halorhodospira halochloris TaxID=1052 RepID=UPI001EE9A660|nr:type III-B CRISPR module-associated protein Cmr3 [Halorhodospira halochloris]MCG5531159.1 type III-B CRISPR module-associated protein Cmr3 [Halorhodospira halochloris]